MVAVHAYGAESVGGLRPGRRAEPMEPETQMEPETETMPVTGTTGQPAVGRTPAVLKWAMEESRSRQQRRVRPPRDGAGARLEPP